MRMVLLLLRANLLERPLRAVLTALAAACAVCLVVWVVSGYRSVIDALDLYASRALGRYVLVVDPVSRRADRAVPPEAVERLRADPAVAAADPMWAGPATFAAADRRAETVLAGTDAAAPPFALLRGRWIADDADDGLQAVLSAGYAAELGADVDAELRLPRQQGDLPVRVVGIVDNPPAPVGGVPVGTRQLPSPSVAGAFVSLRDAAAIRGERPSITFVAVALHPGADVHAVRYAWGPWLNALPQPAQVMTDYDLEEELEEAAYASQVGIQMWVVGAVAGLLAFLVVSLSLAVGVGERIRRYALLRAVCLTRGQVAAVVLGEGLAMTAAGVALGLPLGAAAVSLLGTSSGRVLRHGAEAGWAALAAAAGVALLAALAAGLLPAWRATRVRPLDAIAPRSGGSGGRRPPWLLAVLALPLLAVAPTLSFLLPPSPDEPVAVRLVAGAAALVVGLALLAPLLVRLADAVLAPPVARLLLLPPELLAGQLASRTWRSAGSALTLSVGLGLFAAIHVWGGSMVQTFVPGSWAPDATVMVGPEGLTPDEVRAVAAHPGVDPQRCQPIVSEHPRLREDITGSAERATVTRQNAVIVVGIDPAGAFAGEHPLVGGRWTAGSPAAAMAAMRAGRGCVVSDHFLRETGLGVGDSFVVVPPEDPGRDVTYVIAGAVRFDGWHWLTKLTGLRQRTHRAGALVIADYATVAADFALPRPRQVWLRTAGGAVDEAALTAAVRAGHARAVGRPLAPLDAPAGDAGPRARVVATAAVGDAVHGAARVWLWAMSILPLIAMAISAAGMLTVILSSVQERRWELGILRAVGFGRGAIVRLVIAEGLLCGLVACAIGLAFGVIAGWSGTGTAMVVSWFGGLEPVLIVPLGALAAGCLVLLLFAALAAAWPAARVGRAEPLDLLRIGRG